jgi:hypothetical protein
MVRIFNNTIKSYAMENSIPLNRLSVITTDGMPTMTGSASVFIAHCKKDEYFQVFNLGELLFHPGVTSSFSDPLSENTFFCPLHVSA